MDFGLRKRLSQPTKMRIARVGQGDGSAFEHSGGHPRIAPTTLRDAYQSDAEALQ